MINNELEIGVLTLEAAKQLIGKKISYETYGPSKGIVYSGELIIGSIVSKWDYYKTQPMSGWESRTAYWDSYVEDHVKVAFMETLFLLNEKGEHGPHYLRAYPDMYGNPMFNVDCRYKTTYFQIIE